MLLAVLEKRGGLKVSACDAYLNIIGGLNLDEPAADLAAIVALASSYLDRPVPADLVAIGEVGLTGELRNRYTYSCQPTEPTGVRGPAAWLLPVSHPGPPERGTSGAGGASSDPGPEYR